MNAFCGRRFHYDPSRRRSRHCAYNNGVVNGTWHTTNQPSNQGEIQTSIRLSYSSPPLFLLLPPNRRMALCIHSRVERRGKTLFTAFPLLALPPSWCLSSVRGVCLFANRETKPKMLRLMSSVSIGCVIFPSKKDRMDLLVRKRWHLFWEFYFLVTRIQKHQLLFQNEIYLVDALFE